MRLFRRPFSSSLFKKTKPSTVLAATAARNRAAKHSVAMKRHVGGSSFISSHHLRPSSLSSCSSSVSSSSSSSSSSAFKPQSANRLIKQFHALSLEQKDIAVAKVLQATNKYVGQDDIELFFREADRDKDGVLSNDEFREFLTTRFCLKTFRAHAENKSTSRPTNYQLKLVMISAAIPFVGFGMVDNLIMIIGGDAMEEYFHLGYPISMMAAMCWANLVGDVIGLSLGGVVETLARNMGIPDPRLSKHQLNMPITNVANLTASSFGIAVGCILGMIPLLFVNFKNEEEEQEKREKLAKRASEKHQKSSQSSQDHNNSSNSSGSDVDDLLNPSSSSSSMLLATATAAATAFDDGDRNTRHENVADVVSH